MNSEFSKIITEQRKKRKLSQKQAAADLGISQALLSHYEKGIRECGLDFVVKAADYYNISCDTLLGRKIDNTQESESGDEIKNTAEQLAKLCNNSDMENEISDFIMLNFYKLLCITNQNNKSFCKLPVSVTENIIDSIIMNKCASIKLKSQESSADFSENVQKNGVLKNLIEKVESKIMKFHNTL